MLTVITRTSLFASALLLAACADQQGAAPASTPNAAATAQKIDPALAARIEKLAKSVEYAEDVSALKRLQRAYGYYVDKGLWTDLADFFADDAVANYPAGTFKGKASIREHLYRNVGGVEVGQVGLGDNRLYNHLNLQPVVHLNADGQSGRGRWRAMAMFGRFGGPPGTWAEGIYNMTYAKVNGVWKIKTLDYGSDYGDTYTNGWGGNPNPAPRRAQTYAHPADAPHAGACNGFPEACVTPFLYKNPGTSSDSAAWTLPASLPAQPMDNAAARVGTLLQQAQLLSDEHDIENLIRSYGYYYDRADWDQITDLFADKGTVEFAQQGVYVGKARIRQYLGTMNAVAGRKPEQQGLVDGWLNDHVQLQTIVSVAPDGRTARARNREWDMLGVAGKSGQWSDGIYENSFVKDNGVWKIASLHYFPTYITDYDKGWTADAQPAPGPLATLPPDAPPTVVYQIYPKAHVPAFHYVNPVTGKEATYPQVGAPSAASRAATLFKPASYAPLAVRDIATAVAQAEALVQKTKDYDEIENLENAYGYYLDKNLWNDLADLFAVNGSMELAQRGVYKGRERVRQSLFKVFGTEGPQLGRLGNHIHMQTVILVNPDGLSGKVRSRMMQQLSFTGRPSMGAAVYENDVVKEDGKWKYAATHAYNTWTAAYAGGWVKAQPNARVPGPSADFPPDAPPSFKFAMFPTVYEIPANYPNPVTGRK